MRAVALAAVLALPSQAGDFPADALFRLGVSTGDLDVRPDRWPAPGAPPTVIAALRSPAEAPALAAPLLDGLIFKRTAAERAAAAAALLDRPKVALDVGGVPPDPGGLLDKLPAEVREPVRRLAAAAWEAQFLLRVALERVPPQDRARWLEVVLPQLLNEPAVRPEPEVFGRAGEFQAGHLAAGAAALVEAAEAAAPALKRARGSVKGVGRYDSPVGPIVLAGAQDDEHGAADMAGATLFIDLGGRNRYAGPAAAAGAGEVRLVLDLGKDAVVESTGPAASGVFGVGVLALLGDGKARLRAGDLSAGAGLFGAGAFLSAGPCDLETGRLSQGAGAYGTGLAACDGDGSRLVARASSQGYGATSGAGLLFVTGDDARLDCGLVDPDPRDPLATLAVCQGAGYGPRAYAAGGVGAAVVDGDRAALSSGYFAQGSAYWHSLGYFHGRGKGHRLQARRYAQGAGIHSGVGILRLEVSSSSLVNWGVGPAYGWDWGVGWLLLDGDDNRLSTEWGTGHGDVNGHAFARVRGKRNALALPGFGSGAVKRLAASYGVARVEGDGSRVRLLSGTETVKGPSSLSPDPWGVLELGDGASLDAAFTPEAGSWRSPDREAAAGRERGRLEALLRRADSLHRREALGEWLSLASGFGLDEGVPAEAARRLLTLTDDEARLAAHHVHPAHFVEYLWQRVLAAAYPTAGDSIAEGLASARGMRKAMLAGLLRWRPAREGRQLLALLKDPDWRVRREAAAALGYLLDKQEGEEPGRRRLLKTVLAAARGDAASFRERIGREWPADLYAVLALDPELKEADRLALMEKSPSFAEPVNPAGLDWLARRLDGRKPLAAAFEAEIAGTDALSREAAPRLRELLEDKDPLVLCAVLAALGQNAAPFDAALIAVRLDHPNGAVREAAAQALAAMGGVGRAAIEYALSSKDARTRLFAVKAAARSADPAAVELIGKAFDDPAPEVRAAALASLTVIQSPLKPSKDRLSAVGNPNPINW